MIMWIVSVFTQVINEVSEIKGKAIRKGTDVMGKRSLTTTPPPLTAADHMMRPYGKSL